MRLIEVTVVKTTGSSVCETNRFHLLRQRNEIEVPNDSLGVRQKFMKTDITSSNICSTVLFP